jgi:FlaA1/EpsC-like NDP-sugar epimerase
MKSVTTWKLSRLLLALLDGVLVAVSLGVAYELRFDFHVLPEYKNQFIHLVPCVILLRLFLFWLFNLYRGIIRYASVSELIAIGISVIIGTSVLSLFNILTPHITSLNGFPIAQGEDHLLRIPWSIVIIDALLAVVLIGGARFSRRILITAGQYALQRARRVLIIGAGDLGESVAREMLKSPHRGLRPVVFIDEDPAKVGRLIHNIQVAGRLEDVHNIVEKFQVDEIVIALPHPSPKQLALIVEECRKTPVQFKIVPSMHDVMTGRVAISQLRPVDVEDLLGREEVRMELSPEQNYIKNKCVLITGAGGSIGSEICRQTLQSKPSRVILFGKGENSIYEIADELRFRYKDVPIETVIGDIRDPDKVEQIFSRYKPEIIFHAAAHKHVPFMEFDPDEAVKNNVFGTAEVALAANRHNAGIFVLISTDKAVRPTSVMGATKRLAEMVVFSLNQDSSTDFIAVRFGNVLGSRGSVVPLFKKQIERGGPVTVTDPNVERYFMTVPEAVSLVVQSGSLRDKASLFVLDMGNRVKIVDLARQIITLYGYKPGEDIDIEFVGLRPGEKINEELLTENEGVRKTDAGKIFAANPDVVPWDEVQAWLNQLGDAVHRADPEEIRKILKDIVPGYTPMEGGGMKAEG